MKIPEAFEKILRSNAKLHQIVLDTIVSYQPIFEDNKLFFFEEYTDHGIKHIENVLLASELLISPESLKILTPKDIAILILGVILHDIGMHVEFSTFNNIIEGKYDESMNTTIDDMKWTDLWNEYLVEAKRFSSKQKLNIFGDENYQFRIPDLNNKDNLNGFDKKLIGEFIRRHHARLANEIAFQGIFGSNSKSIKFGNEKLAKIHRQLSGILARSHGMNIRDTFPYLEEIANEAWRNPDDVNIVFLMVVLRLADYIQIDQSRVSPFLIKLKTFNSPISLKEHQTHLTINSISFIQPDKEKIYVNCEPKTSEILIKIRNLISDIQNEFDKSWAIMGEIYGFMHKNKPTIKFRRISSNLSSKKFLNKLNFVPERINFDVNNELSKLLVGPLYGNNPTYGVRELIQNAVDACVERDYIDKENQNYVPHILLTIDKIDDNKNLFTIQDNGKGMSLNEIINYFLNVGSSFRKSLSWKKSFQDDQGTTQIKRSGKFGIGVLASFLLGDEISVKTINHIEQIEYSFTTRIDSEFIEISKSDNIEDIGTKITIVISDDKKNELLESQWTDWYLFDYPKIDYYVENVKINKNINVDRNEFFEFQTENFDKIEWRYSVSKKTYYGTRMGDCLVACNGILICRDLSYSKKEFVYENQLSPVIEYKPSLLISDKEGILPIKLDRNDLDCTKLPFEDALLEEVSKKLILDLLTVTLDSNRIIEKQIIENHNCQVLYSKEGYSFAFDYFLNKLVDYPLIRIVSKNDSLDNEFILDNDLIYFVPNHTIKLTYQERIVAPESGCVALLRNKHYQNLFKSKKNRIRKFPKRTHKKELEQDNITLYSFLLDNQDKHVNKYIEVMALQKFNHIETVQEIKSKFFKREAGKILNNLLSKYIGNNVIIPYDLDKRKEIFAKAFYELKHLH